MYLPTSVFPTTIRALGYLVLSSNSSISDVGLYHVVFRPLNIKYSASYLFVSYIIQL